MGEGQIARKTPSYRIKSRPSLPTAKAELKKKSFVDSSICGWIGGNPDLPALCSAGSLCVRDSIHKYVGCCQTSGSCAAGIYTRCIDQSNHDWSPPEDVQTNGVYTCSMNSQCYQNTYAGGYSQYGCGRSSWAATVETTYTGQPSDVALQLLYTSVTFSAMHAALDPLTSPTPSLTSSPAYPTSFLANDTVAPSNWAPTPTFSFIPPPPTSPDMTVSNEPTANTLAGIVIGSVNGAVILVVLAICLYLRRRKQRCRTRALANLDQRTIPEQDRAKNVAHSSRLPLLSPLRCFSPLQNFLPMSMRQNDSPPAYQYAEVAIPAPYRVPRNQSSLSHMYPFVLESSQQLVENPRSISGAVSTPNPKPTLPSLSINSNIGVAVSLEQESLLRRKQDESPIYEECMQTSNSSHESDPSPPPHENPLYDCAGPTSFLDDDDTISDDSGESMARSGNGLGPRYQPVNQENFYEIETRTYSPSQI